MISFSALKKEPIVVLVVVALIFVSVIILNSVAPQLFPQYYIFIILGLLMFYIFASIDFEFFTTFSFWLFALSLILLILPIIIGEVTRGVVRWIPIGSFTLQPAEIARPFIFLFFSSFLSSKFERLSIKRIIISFILFLLPFGLIFMQPSFGVAMVTLVGFAGIILAVNFEKKILLYAPIIAALALPAVWFLLAPYQKQRVLTVLSSNSDPLGAGYNSAQALISVGSGMLSGRGLGSGVQTQLSFLPERHTDFVFAAVSEEMGFLGSALVILLVFTLLYRIIISVQYSKNITVRAFTSAVFLSLLAQSTVHIGMNAGLLPITGLPLPLFSAGGSSFLGTCMMLGMVLSARK